MNRLEKFFLRRIILAWFYPDARRDTVSLTTTWMELMRTQRSMMAFFGNGVRRKFAQRILQCWQDFSSMIARRVARTPAAHAWAGINVALVVFFRHTAFAGLLQTGTTGAHALKEYFSFSKTSRNMRCFVGEFLPQLWHAYWRNLSTTFCQIRAQDKFACSVVALTLRMRTSLVQKVNKDATMASAGADSCRAQVEELVRREEANSCLSCGLSTHPGVSDLQFARQQLCGRGVACTTAAVFPRPLYQGGDQDSLLPWGRTIKADSS